jgi:hypothetical protein
LVVPPGLLLAAAGMAWLTRLGLHSSYTAHILPPLLLVGAGLGLAMPAAMSRATLGVQMTDQGVASATANTMQQLGGAVGLALLNTLADSAATSYAMDHLAGPLLTADATLHGYATAYWWATAFFAAGALVTVLLFRRKRAGRPAASGAQASRPRAAVSAELASASGIAGTGPDRTDGMHGMVPSAAGDPVRLSGAISPPEPR